MDTVRSVSPVTFMSNMLYACSILYKTKLPFIVVMNKVSGESHHAKSLQIGMWKVRSKLVDGKIEEFKSEVPYFFRTFFVRNDIMIL